MVKRKSNDSELVPRKRAKVNHLAAAAPDRQTLDLWSPANPVRPQKHKRTRFADEPSEESESCGEEESTAKRAKRCSSDPDPLAPWPGLMEQPRLERGESPYDSTQTDSQQLDSQQLDSQQLDSEAMLFPDEDSIGDTDSNHRNPLPSPDISDDEAAQYASIESFGSRDVTPPASRIVRSPTPASRIVRSPTLASRIVRSPTPASRIVRSPTPASRILRSPKPASTILRSIEIATPRRKEKRESRGQRKKRAQNALDTLEGEQQNFLRSKRSSRRDKGCSLWHLADNGKAYPVAYT